MFTENSLSAMNARIMTVMEMMFLSLTSVPAIDITTSVTTAATPASIPVIIRDIILLSLNSA